MIISKVLQRNIEKIEELLITDLSFREIFDDYERSTLVLNHLELSPNQKSKRIQEYKTIIKELEVEILKYIHNHSERKQNDD